ncbi:hypothetical protein [Methanococcus aeolicus]|uniref:hypothetical protein n=1 Tax=Methanococcus aeolicus TaxID=42879 RepID=UPI0021C69BCE|nr:hypothetical protein [Methanococcus aeolicus]UXM84196.1 hypothetical protein N6C89_05405 [Methanococcus aeolicus]
MSEAHEGLQNPSDFVQLVVGGIQIIYYIICFIPIIVVIRKRVETNLSSLTGHLKEALIKK